MRPALWIMMCFLMIIIGFSERLGAKEIFFGDKKGQEVQDSEDLAEKRHQAMMEALKGVKQEMTKLGEAAQMQLSKAEEKEKIRMQMAKTQEEIRALLEAILTQLRENAGMEPLSGKSQGESSGADGRSTYRYQPQSP